MRLELWLPLWLLREEFALDEILASCFWRSLFFYLKDLCWHNGDVMKIEPVVAAQHVVNC